MEAWPLQHAVETEFCTNFSVQCPGKCWERLEGCLRSSCRQNEGTRQAGSKHWAQDSRVVNNTVCLYRPLWQHSLSLPLAEHCLHPSLLGYITGRLISINLTKVAAASWPWSLHLVVSSNLWPRSSPLHEFLELPYETKSAILSFSRTVF